MNYRHFVTILFYVLINAQSLAWSMHKSPHHVIEVNSFHQPENLTRENLLTYCSQHKNQEHEQPEENHVNDITPEIVSDVQKDSTFPQLLRYLTEHKRGEFNQLLEAKKASPGAIKVLTMFNDISLADLQRELHAPDELSVVKNSALMTALKQNLKIVTLPLVSSVFTGAAGYCYDIPWLLTTSTIIFCLTGAVTLIDSDCRSKMHLMDHRIKIRNFKSEHELMSYDLAMRTPFKDRTLQKETIQEDENPIIF
jgi:hypothetical protein